MNPVIIGDCQLYLGDCRDILPTLPKVDAVITDPPYGINYKPEGGGKVKKNFTNADRVFGDDEPFDPSILMGLGAISIIWGGSNFAFRLPSTRCWLVWDKKCGIYETNQFSDCEIAWTTKDSPIKIFRHRWTGYHRDGQDQGNHHPTQKPIELMRWCIEQAGNPKTILDPFMGSGTTGVAAVQMGRSFIGIERESKYFDIACKRIEQAYAQGDFFVAPPKAKQEQVSLI